MYPITKQEQDAIRTKISDFVSRTQCDETNDFQIHRVEIHPTTNADTCLILTIIKRLSPGKIDPAAILKAMWMLFPCSLICGDLNSLNNEEEEQFAILQIIVPRSLAAEKTHQKTSCCKKLGKFILYLSFGLFLLRAAVLITG